MRRAACLIFLLTTSAWTREVSHAPFTLVCPQEEPSSANAYPGASVGVYMQNLSTKAETVRVSIEDEEYTVEVRGAGSPGSGWTSLPGNRYRASRKIPRGNSPATVTIPAQGNASFAFWSSCRLVPAGLHCHDQGEFSPPWSQIGSQNAILTQYRVGRVVISSSKPDGQILATIDGHCAYPFIGSAEVDRINNYFNSGVPF